MSSKHMNPARHAVDGWQWTAARPDGKSGWLGMAAVALALAWVLQRGDHLIPIPGTRSAEHLTAWAAAPAITLTPDDLARIDQLLPVGWAWGDRYDDAQSATAERYC